MSSAEPPLPAAVGPDNSRFTLIKVLGSGSFGVVFSAVDTVTGASVAVKLERLDAKHPQLAYEHRVLRWLSPPTEGPLPAFTGFPTPLWFGESAHHAVLVESLHGPSLEDLFSWCGRTFSLKTTLTLGLQMVSRIEAAHAKQILHRDIKPDNWVLGIGPAEPVRHVSFARARLPLPHHHQYLFPFAGRLRHAFASRLWAVQALRGRRRSAHPTAL